MRQDKPRTAQLEKPPNLKMTVNLAVTCGDAASNPLLVDATILGVSARVKGASGTRTDRRSRL